MSTAHERSNRSKVRGSSGESRRSFTIDRVYSRPKLEGLQTVIFVFGSNRQGRHGKGAALTAVKNHGAIYGQAGGLQGNSWAIITKELRKEYPPVTLGEIKTQVSRLKGFASKHSSWIFQVSPIGCGLAGFTPEQIAPLFKNSPENMKLPKEFVKVLNG